MLDAVMALLQQQWDNQVFAGGLALGALGAMAAVLTRVAWAAVRVLATRLLPSLTIDRRSPLFGYVQAWLRDHPYTRSCRALTAAPTAGETSADEAVWLVPGEGSHLLRHGRTWFWLHRSCDIPAGKGAPERESLRFQALSLRRATLTNLVGDILRSHGRRAGTLALHAATSYGEWSELCRIACRPLATVIVAGGAGEALLDDARRFLGAKDWYAARGVPWRRGYLFHGPPGTGKLPDIFDGVQFRGIGRQRQQGNVVGDHQRAAGLVPAGTIENEDGVGAGGDLAADFGQVQGHGFDVDRWQDQRRRRLPRRTDGAEYVDPGIATISRCRRA